jgi:hypothetical protein
MNTLSINAKYTLGIGLWMTLYVVILIGSISLIKHHHPTGLLLYVLAIAPALPIGGTILVFQRHLDKLDEYVRGVLTKRFVTATGLTLFLCTAWGFLENGANVHHFSLYLVYPLFWMCFGVASLFYRKVA